MQFRQFVRLEHHDHGGVVVDVEVHRARPRRAVSSGLAAVWPSCCKSAFLALASAESAVGNAAIVIGKAGGTGSTAQLVAGLGALAQAAGTAQQDAATAVSSLSTGDPGYQALTNLGTSLVAGQKAATAAQGIVHHGQQRLPQRCAGRHHAVQEGQHLRVSA